MHFTLPRHESQTKDAYFGHSGRISAQQSSILTIQSDVKEEILEEVAMSWQADEFTENDLRSSLEDKRQLDSRDIRDNCGTRFAPPTLRKNGGFPQCPTRRRRSSPLVCARIRPGADAWKHLSRHDIHLTVIFSALGVPSA